MQFTLINFAEEFLATKNNINMDVVRFYDAPPKNFIKVKKISKSLDIYYISFFI